MRTSGEPLLMGRQVLSPRLAAGLPLIMTLLLPPPMDEEWTNSHLGPKTWTWVESPCLAAPRPLMSTSREPVTITGTVQS